MDLITRIKIGYKNTELLGKCMIWFAIAVFIFEFVEGNESEQNITDKINSSTDTITLGQNELKTLILTDKISDWNVSNCLDVVGAFKSKFPDLTCLVSTKTESCISNPTLENGTVLIDGCDIAYRKIALPDSGYAIGIRFKPLWNANIDSMYYLLDIVGSENPERNRISLYIQNGYLKYLILNEHETEEHILKLKLENKSVWNEKEFNSIEIRWVKDQNRMFLDVNGNEYNQAVGNISLNTSNSIMFLGSTIFGNYQADGYYDYWFVRAYMYPEPTYSIGVEQRIS